MEQARSKQYVSLIYLALALATIIAYEPLRHNDFISYDDYAYVTENPQVQAGITRESIFWAFTTSYKANWHPLTWLSHMLDCELFGLDPVWHHLSSLLLHAANTLLLFWVLQKMTGAVWPSGFVAAVFALHPLNVESVAWVAERKNVLSGFFWMLTIAAYIRYAKRPGIGRFVPVFFALGLGLMAKPMLVTLPFVLLLLDYWPLGRFQWGRQNRRETSPLSKSVNVSYQRSTIYRLVGEKIPLFVLIVVFGAVTFIAQQSGGAMLPVENLSLNSRIANALVSYISYIDKMIYPSRLAVFYPHPADSLPLWQPIVCFTVLAIVSAAIIYTARQKRYLAVGWLWYLGTLVPVIGLIQVGSQAIADRYTYLPSIGIFIMVAWGGGELPAKWRYRGAWLGISAGLLLAAMVTCTRTQVQLWKNNLTLYEHTLAVTENNSIIQNSYGCALFEEDRLNEAIVQLNEALQISPEFSLARGNLGKVFLKQGKVNEAIACFNEALRTSKDQPDVYYYLGLAKVRQKKHNDAISHFSEALRLKPDYINAHLHLAYSLAEVGRIQPAAEHCYKILQLEPDRVGALNTLAWILATTEDTKFQNPTEAVKFAEKACELTNYENPGALDTLAAAYAAAGRFHEAIETAEKAVELAAPAGEKGLAEEIEERLQLYKSGRSYRWP